MNVERQKRALKEVVTRRPRTTLIGSFRFKPLIDTIHTTLERRGIEVLAPAKGLVTGEIGGFPLIQGDDVTSKEGAVELERRFLEAAINSDILLLINPESYHGIMSAWEMGFVMAHKIPLFSLDQIGSDEPEHPTHQLLRRSIPRVSLDVFASLAFVARENNKRPAYKIIGTPWRVVPAE